MKTTLQRFEEKYVIHPTGCWMWIAATTAYRYGGFYFEGRWERAHKVAYELYRGSVGSQCVLHKCDTPLCVNPDHLFLGTQQDNIADMVKKRRHTMGEKHANWKGGVTVGEDAKILYSKRYYEKNKARMMESNRQYQQANRERINSLARVSYLKRKLNKE